MKRLANGDIYVWDDLVCADCGRVFRARLHVDSKTLVAVRPDMPVCPECAEKRNVQIEHQVRKYGRGGRLSLRPSWWRKLWPGRTKRRNGKRR